LRLPPVPENNSPLSATTGDYEAKIAYEADQLVRRAIRAGFPQPFGDPLSGIVLVAETNTEATNAATVDALQRSLAAVKLAEAYVTWTHPNLSQEMLSLEPAALVAVGPAAARAIDSCGYSLAKVPFSDAPEGSWFAWTKGASGLRLPALAPALGDAEAKRHFWRAFLALRALVA
jgi:hypothetical protein